MLYYMKDMSLVGYGFVVGGIKKTTSRKTIVTGDLLFNGKSYPALVCAYNSGRAARLLDVMGKDEKEAERNLKQVVEHMSFCIAHNVNGLRGIVFRRSVLRLTRFLATSLSLITLWLSIFLCLQTNRWSYFIPIIAVSLFVVFSCFLVSKFVTDLD